MGRPKTLNDIIGQESCKEVLNTLIKFAKNKKEQIPHIILHGSSGCGKTSIASVIAAEMGSDMFYVNCSTINKPEKIFKIIEGMNQFDVLLLDESQSLSKKVSEACYNLLEDFYYFENGCKIDIPKITVIAATTSIGSMLLPLKNRFRFACHLEPYSEEEMIEICYGICKERGFNLSRELAKTIAATSRGIPRKIVDITNWVYKFMIGNSLKKINKDKLLEIISLMGINKDGLERVDLEYLQILKENRSGLSINGICSKLESDMFSVKNLVEPYLLKLNFIQIQKGSGRSLTSVGRKYIDNINVL